jgi:hypothetical protein
VFKTKCRQEIEMRFDAIDVERQCEAIAADLESSLRDYMTDIPESLVEIMVNEIWEFDYTEMAISQLESEYFQSLEDRAEECRNEGKYLEYQLLIGIINNVP